MTTPPPTARPNRDLPALLALALGWRLLFLLAVPRVLDTADAIHYVETAAALASGDFFGYDPKIPVLYPLLGALYTRLLPVDLEWACRLVSFTASVLLVVPVYGLCRDLHGRAAARLAGLLVALWPWLADYGCSISTDATGALLWLTGVWLFTRGINGHPAALYGALAAFFGLTLTRPEGLFIFTCTVPGILVLAWPVTVDLLRRILPFFILTSILLGLTAFYVRAVSGAATVNYRVGFIVNEFDVLRFVHTAVQTVSDVIPVMLGPVLFFFLGVGFLLPREQPRNFRLEACVLLFAFAQWAISLFVLSPAPRYLMAPLLVLSLWSACGMALCAAKAAALPGRLRQLRFVPTAALVLFMLVHTGVTLGSEHVGRTPREPREYKEAGRWMAEHLEPGLIFSRKPQVGFYAGMPSTGPNLSESLEAALDRARKAGARYLVVDERYTAAMVPSLRPLLEPEAAPPGLRHLRSFATWPGARVAIYALTPDETASP